MASKTLEQIVRAAVVIAAVIASQDIGIADTHAMYDTARTLSRVKGNADGSLIQAVDYASGGDFAGSGAGWSFADFDHDHDVDRGDFLQFQECFTGPFAGPPALGCEDKDLDHDGDVDQDDSGIFGACISGTYMPIDPQCLGSDLPASGTSAMHGLTVDVLPDGKTLLFARARHYDLKHGRWLQRDPLGFADGPNLYEAFGGNPLTNLDPEGAGIITALFGVGYERSDWQFVKDTLSTAGGMAADMKYGFSRTIGYSVGIDRHPSNCQQRLINLVNAEARYGGQTEASELFGRATLRALSDSIVATSLDTAATGSIFVYTKDGEVYRLQASGFERVQATVSAVGQGAGTAALVAGPLQKMASIEARSATIASSTPRPTVAIVADGSGNVGLVSLNDALSSAPVRTGGAVYGELDALGRPTGVSAAITKDMIATGTPASASIRPPGFQGGATGQARGHLFGAQLGGSGTDVRNLVTLQQTPANSPMMRGFESQIRAAVEGGQVVHVTFTPVYYGSSLVPRGITIMGQGSGGFRVGVSILNPPGFP